MSSKNNAPKQGDESVSSKRSVASEKEAAAPEASAARQKTVSQVYPHKPVEINPLSAKREFILAPKRSAGSAALRMLSNSGADLISQLRAYAGIDIDVVGSLKAGLKNPLQVLASSSSQPDALLVRMDAERGRELQSQSTQSASAIWVDENHQLDHFGDFLRQHLETASFVNTAEQGVPVGVLISTSDGKPLVGATVTLHGLGLPISQVSDDSGVVQFSIRASLIPSISALVVEPASMHWSKVIKKPPLLANMLNAISVESLFGNNGFQASSFLSWGLKTLALPLDRLSMGGGVRVGIIDSGCDTNHELLAHITKGVDFNPSAPRDGWQYDEIGHGTHCVGVISARPNGKDGFIGIAPAAEIHIYKVFPNASFFTLSQAIAQAVADGVDVLNMSLGSSEIAPSVAEALASARDSGVTCIVAAGNSADDVKFPANLSSVLAISALGSTANIPSDSISAYTFNPAYSTLDGYFSPSFTCHGLAVDFAGPGVGIISTFPGNSYKALDGTSMAAPHITGLAALFLAHDPLLRNMPRTAARVDMLFMRMQQSLIPLPFGRDRAGVGLPQFNASWLQSARPASIA